MAKASSIYWICRSILAALETIPGFSVYLEQTQHNKHDMKYIPSPCQHLWQVCRQGDSLCFLFNLLRPDAAIELKGTENSKAMVYMFLIACRQHLGWAEQDMFTVSEMYQDDVNGFVKVVETIQRVLRRLREQGCLSTYPAYPEPPLKKGTVMSEQVLLELLETERKYVQDLETLQIYAQRLKPLKVVSLDTLHHIFGNLHDLLDFQIRFLMQIEHGVDQGCSLGFVGTLFVNLEDAFSVYEPYCTNVERALELVLQWRSQLEILAHCMDPVYTLPSLLITPVQRLCKYPLLVQQLLKNTPLHAAYRPDLQQGLATIQRVACKINETRRFQENQQTALALQGQVVDWRGFDINDFGPLYLHDKLVVHRNDNATETHVYLFEKHLMVCKESTGKKAKKKKELLMQGLIHIANVVQIDNDTVQTLSLRIFWSSNQQVSELKSFTLEFRNDEQLTLWEMMLTKLVQADKKKKQQQRASYFDTTESSHETRSPSFSSQVTTLDIPPLSPSYVYSSPSSPSTSSSRSARTSSGSSFNGVCIRDPEQSEDTFLGRRRSRSHSFNSCRGGPHTMARPLPSIHHIVNKDEACIVPNPTHVRMTLHYLKETKTVFAPGDISYADLLALIERKTQQNSEPHTVKGIKYRDEEGDLVTIRCDDDVRLAFEIPSFALHIYITI